MDKALDRQPVADRLEATQKLLIQASIGSCTCGVKSPDLVFHSADCRFVLLQNALENIEQTISADPPPLTVDCLRSLPGGAIDDSDFEKIEDALDRIDAPSMKDGRWLTLAERIAALPRENRVK